MTSETMRDLLEPLIGEFGSVSIFGNGIGQVVLSMGEHKKLTGVEVRSDGLVRLEREHGLWVAIDPGEVAAVAWNDDPETHPGQFL
jgi:hypothetical protein